MIAEETRNWADGWFKEGEERGRENTARRMLDSGMDVALIARLAELSEEHVRRLADQPSPR